MENNDSPYIYEKPLRVKGTKVTKSIVALGLVALGTVIGGTAFANSPASLASSAQDNELTPALSETVSATSAQIAGDQILASGASVDTQGAPIVAVPFEKAAPQKNSAAIELPKISADAFGNTSSATPSAGGGQSGANTTSYKNHADSDDDRDEREHDDEDDDEENENEED